MALEQTDIAFSCECETTGQLLEEGLAALERAEPGSSDGMFLPLLLLGAGFERLCKLVLWRAGYSTEKSHKIDELLKEVVTRCFSPQYRSFRAGREDFEFLTQERNVSSFIQLLTLFSTGGRYHDLDVLREGSSKNHTDARPSSVWRRWDLGLNESNLFLRNLANQTGGLEYRYALGRHRVRFAERLFRAICRLLSPNVLEPRGRLVSGGSLIRFAQLPDDALGKTDYICLMRWYDPFEGFRQPDTFAYASVPLGEYPQCLEGSG